MGIRWAMGWACGLPWLFLSYPTVFAVTLQTTYRPPTDPQKAPQNPPVNLQRPTLPAGPSSALAAPYARASYYTQTNRKRLALHGPAYFFRIAKPNKTRGFPAVLNFFSFFCIFPIYSSNRLRLELTSPAARFCRSSPSPMAQSNNRG